MKILEKEFVTNADKTGDQKFVQLRKENGVALYERIRKDGSHFAYEVFVVKTIKAGAKLPNGAFVKEDYEKYPGANQWGKTAWSAATLDIAEDKFDALVKKLKNDGGKPKRGGAKRGNNKAELVLPVGEFTMKMLVASTGMTQPVLYLRIKSLISEGKVVEVRRGVPEGCRGRPTIIYKAA